MATRALGINGLGRIGKLSVWHHLAHGEFDELVVNAGRSIGKSLDAVVSYLARDSTYGPLHRYLGGMRAERDIRVADADKKILHVHGKTVRLLMTERDPRKLPWREHGVRVVVDCTGAFTDPGAPADAPKGSLRGHLAAGASAVIVSTAFKSKDKSAETPADAATLIHGINHALYDPTTHAVISAASCTTTGLAHMLKPLLEHKLTARILTAGMSTIHAATNSQSVLDAVPDAGDSDLRKSRMALSNVILTSTNAAKALEQVIPQIRSIGFMADSVRIPTPTASLIILNLTVQTELGPDGKPAIDRALVNRIYSDAAQHEAKGLVRYTEEQNVSCDMVGEDAAIVIEAADTHTRTGFIELDVPIDGQASRRVRVPVTHIKVFGWYDNELGSYTHQLGALTRHIARS